MRLAYSTDQNIKRKRNQTFGSDETAHFYKNDNSSF